MRQHRPASVEHSVLDLYAQPAAMTAAGKHARLFDELPSDVGELCRIVQGLAWAQCRTGNADAAKFGIFKGELRGLWFIAGNLVRDVAALNRVEMLPWDVWGAMPRPDEPLPNDRLGFFDRVAALTRAPDTAEAELRALYEGDDRLRVPSHVFNAVLQRQEAV
jgi:hypothetical protein